MKKVKLLPLIILLFFSENAFSTVDISVFRTSEWIFPEGGEQRGEKEITMQAYRNGHDGFQLAVTMSGQCLNNVEIELNGALENKEGERIPLNALSMYREIPLHITTPTGMHPELYPEGEVFDPLLPLSTQIHQNRAVTEVDFIGNVGSSGKSYLAAGDGGCFTGGCYDGKTKRNYIVEIDRSGPIGIATFRWTDDWNGKLGNRAYQYYTKEHKVSSWKGEHIKVSRKPVTLTHGVTVRFTPGGVVLNKTHKHYKNLSTSSFVAGDRFYFQASPARTAAVYGDIHVPEEQPPGLYKGSLQVRISGENVVELPVSLEVYDIVLPKERNIETAFGGRPKVRRYHQGDEERISAIQKRYEEMLHQHRLDYQSFGVVPRFTFNADDELIAADWREFDRIAGPRLDGSYWDDKIGMERFTLSLNWINPGNPYNKKSQKAREAIWRETARHLKEKGWFDKLYIYCLDEPAQKSLPAVAEEVRKMCAVDPDWAGKFMITTNPFHGSPLEDIINIWVPAAQYYEKWSEYGRRNKSNYVRADYEQLKKSGRTFWLYVANYPLSEPYLSYQLDRKNMFEPRLLKWASWYEGATGFLYYSTMLPGHAVPNPYLNPFYTEVYNRNGKGTGVNGDGQLIYPGDLDGSDSWTRSSGRGLPFAPLSSPLASIRLKQIRDGLEDWEIFLIGESFGLREEIRALVAKVYRRLGEDLKIYKKGDESAPWTKTGARLWEVRDEIARLIMKKKKKS